RTWTQPNIANGQFAQATTDAATFTPGTTYSWSASAGDTIDRSPTTGPCEFTVDDIAPNTAPTIVSNDGQYIATAASSAWSDGVGRAGGFRIDSDGASDHGVNDVVGFLWGPTNPPVTAVAANAMGGSATVNYTPDHAGINDLYARSVHRAGHVG